MEIRNITIIPHQFGLMPLMRSHGVSVMQAKW